MTGIHSVYIIESEKGVWYYGYSENVDQRVQDHNNNRSNYTRFKGPWKLIFRKDFDDKKQALMFERDLKGLKNKTYIRTKFLEYFLK